MKFFLVIMCLFAVAAAAPADADTSPAPANTSRRTLPALQHEEVHDEYGQYALRYVTAEGTIVSERGRLVPTPAGTSYVMVVDGEVSYVGDDGKTYVTKYSAGLDGSHVEGTHLPVSVPVPVVEEPAH